MAFSKAEEQKRWRRWCSLIGVLQGPRKPELYLPRSSTS